MKLYHYWRSSCSWRVRWALAHKGLKTEMIGVGLLDGESESEAHLERNPAGFVPVLELDDGLRLTESMAICEYLEEVYPEKPILPKKPVDRAYVRTLCEIINSGTQPLQNLSVLDAVSMDDARRKEWSAQWIGNGLGIFEKLLKRSGAFCFGDSPTLADCFLVPQVYNALRNDVDLMRTPKVARIYETSLKEPSCAAAHPDRFKP